MSYEVLVPEVTVHKKLGDLRDPSSGEVIGIRKGLGKTYFVGEVIADADFDPTVAAALDDEDHPSHESVSKKFKKVKKEASEDLAARLGLPFDGYDDMSESDVVAAMANLPSQTIQRIKQYEAANEGRSQIVDYNIGFAEDKNARAEGRASSPRAKADNKKTVNKIKARKVTEDSVEAGEGYTGTGDPQVPYGTAKSRQGQRRGRRTRAAATSEGGSSDE
jgi:hypothetical protein